MHLDTTRGGCGNRKSYQTVGEEIKPYLRTQKGGESILAQHPFARKKERGEGTSRDVKNGSIKSTKSARGSSSTRDNRKKSKNEGRKATRQIFQSGAREGGYWRW